MRLNSANRSFFTLAGIVLAPYVLLGLAGCGVLSVVAYRLFSEGFAGLHRGGQDLRPAAALFAMVTPGVVIGAVSLLRQVRATRRLAQWVDERRAALPDDVARCAEDAGLVGRVVVIDEPQPCSFTFGFATPTVAVSAGLATRVDADELRAVLQHERYHVRAYDTLKVLMARAGAAAFFFLPALGHLRDRYLAARELAADRHAVRAVGERPLAGALYRVTDGPSFAEFGAAAALGGTSFLEQRVEQLEHGREPPLPAIPRVALGLTFAGIAVLVAAFVLALANRGTTDMMSMDSMSMDAGGAAVVGVLGAIACTAGAAAVAFLALRRARRHRARRLTS